MTIPDSQSKNNEQLYSREESRALQDFVFLKNIDEKIKIIEEKIKKQKDFNEEHNHDKQNSQAILFSNLLFGKLKISTFSENLADDVSVNLPNATSGIGFVSAQGEEACLFTWTTAGVVSLVANTTNAVNTDTDVKLCVFDGGAYVTIRNRLGATKTIKYLIIY